MRHLRSTLAVFCLAVTGLLLLASRAPLTAPAGAAATEVTRPNILVIMSDDQTVADMRVLPKTRALLGERGTTFANSFVSYPLCCPSRSTFLTGQFPHHHGVMANSGPNGGYQRLDHSNTLPAWLQEAGYYTAHIGKYLNNYGVDSPEPPPGWSRWFGLIDPSTYRMYGYTVSDDGVPVTYGSRPEDYQTDVLAEEAERVLRSRAGSSQPFFVTVAPIAPHLERINGVQVPPRPAPRHEGRFAQEPFPAKPSFNEPDVADKPRHIQRLPVLSTVTSARQVAIYRARLAALLAVDDLVERLVRTLTETGQLERTVIVFTSDNGFLLGEHRIPDQKYYPYEESIRVPLIVRGGGFPAGATAGQLVSNVDLAPTIVALAGARARRKMDGRPLLPLALDPGEGKDRTLFIEGVGSGSGKPSFQAARDARWLYVEYSNGGRELYNLQTDPFELSSRHAAPATAKTRADLARRLARLRSCTGEACR
ncbi:MAG TPA: sulfatase [Thermoanaerobaculia bacterium]|jgi:arylsulfatase A-like enzyme|nr:sulfatase [Thermoanaerobaculia bacterium]